VIIRRHLNSDQVGKPDCHCGQLKPFHWPDNSGRSVVTARPLLHRNSTLCPSCRLPAFSGAEEYSSGMPATGYPESNSKQNSTLITCSCRSCPTATVGCNALPLLAMLLIGLCASSRLVTGSIRHAIWRDARIYEDISMVRCFV